MIYFFKILIQFVTFANHRSTGHFLIDIPLKLIMYEQFDWPLVQSRCQWTTARLIHRIAQ